MTSNSNANVCFNLRVEHGDYQREAGSSPAPPTYPRGYTMSKTLKQTLDLFSEAQERGIDGFALFVYLIKPSQEFDTNQIEACAQAISNIAETFFTVQPTDVHSYDWLRFQHISFVEYFIHMHFRLNPEISNKIRTALDRWLSGENVDALVNAYAMLESM